MIELYDHPFSGNCCKIRLALSHLGVDYSRVKVDVFGGEQHSEGFEPINPARKIPVLSDDGFVIWESNAILFFSREEVRP
ncbi:MAG: glutathione S-transferase N-terminal domain-containing protein [Candidatus Dadabacteria bacterium]|nr:glutathione S-transferase N-terminal domain-containing protein [Candidatus Dadabacteria bacterium]